MKHLVETFYDPEDPDPDLQSKERQAEIWLDEVAKAGFRFAGISASPYIATGRTMSQTETIRSFITLVVVKD